MKPIHQQIFLAISLLTSCIFYLSSQFYPLPGSVLLKWLPVGSLALLTLFTPSITRLLPLALFLHSIGDILLEIDGKRFLLHSMLPFMLGHILYFCIFLRDRKSPNLAQKLGIASLIGYAIAIWLILAGRLSGIFLPAVTLYTAAISGMAIAALLANYSNPWVIVGAASYMISDSLIAFSTFVRPLDFSQYLIWPTYYLGQLAITVGLLMSRNTLFFNNKGEIA